VTATAKRCPFCAEEIQGAAIVCKHCGRDLVTSPAAPVALAPAKTSGPARIVAIVGGLLVLLVVVINLAGGSSPATPQKLLDVSVRQGAGAIEITNAGPGGVAGQELIVYINGSPPFTFKATATMPAIGQSVRIPLMAFTQKDGTRFNPIATAVTVIWVGGGGYDYRSFGK